MICLYCEDKPVYTYLLMLKFKCFILTLLLFCAIDIWAQIPQVGNPTKEDIEKADSTLQSAPKSKNFMFTPYVAPSYSPELQFLFSAGGLMSFKVQPDNPIVERSSIPFSVGYSSNGSTAISILPYIYGKNDSYRILTQFYFKDMPDNYWGVGFEAGDRVSQPDSTTNYHRLWWSVEGKIVKKISKGFFIGISYDINQTKAGNLNSYMKEDKYIKEYGKDISNVGLGLVIELDHRDNAQNAYNGYLLSLALTEYNKIITSSNNEFAKLTFDARKYFPLHDRKTLAIQVKTQFADGDVPWSDLPQLGTPFDLRGYQWGRYRDKTALFGLVEYRHMFNRKTPNKNGNYTSPAGFVLWAGTGSVAPAYNKMNDWLFNAGVGFRLEIQPRMNVRIDYGIAKDNQAFYITFSEAF
ncbi:hypothetical protein E9993_11365 [Labilibacter sediminis]|nr:hypothetical protein E9993_11365 [Labilibacter sediminis]